MQKRAVARKSTSSQRRDMLVGPGDIRAAPPPPPPEEERWDLKGEVHNAPISRKQGYPFKPHECGKICLEDPKFKYTESVRDW